MGNARRAAARIAGESDGARREREIHELEQQFAGPPREKPGGPKVRPEASPQELHDRATMAHGEAMDAVRFILNEGDKEISAVLDAAWYNLKDDAVAAAFCRRVADEIPWGGAKEWFLRLADALEECAEAADEVDRSADRAPSRFRPDLNDPDLNDPRM